MRGLSLSAAFIPQRGTTGLRSLGLSPESWKGAQDPSHFLKFKKKNIFKQLFSSQGFIAVYKILSVQNLQARF